MNTENGKLNKNWIFIAVFIIANILVFRFFSHNLESFVNNYAYNLDSKNDCSNKKAECGTIQE